MHKIVRRVAAISLASLSLAGVSNVAIAESAQSAGKRCNVWTVLQASSPTELCGCKTVTTGMVRHIQRHRDFSEFLSTTYRECPQLAAVLSNFPTASTDPQGDEPAGPDVGGPEDDVGGPEDDGSGSGCGGSCPGFD